MINKLQAKVSMKCSDVLNRTITHDFSINGRGLSKNKYYVNRCSLSSL